MWDAKAREESKAPPPPNACGMSEGEGYKCIGGCALLLPPSNGCSAKAGNPASKPPGVCPPCR